MAGFWWRPSSSLQTAVFSLYLHVVERELESSLGVSFIRTQIPFMKDQPSWSNYLPKPHLLVSSHWSQHRNFHSLPSVTFPVAARWCLYCLSRHRKPVTNASHPLVRASSPVTPSGTYTPATLPLSLFLEKSKLLPLHSVHMLFPWLAWLSSSFP